jgi:hypothetical protein
MRALDSVDGSDGERDRAGGLPRHGCPRSGMWRFSLMNGSVLGSSTGLRPTKGGNQSRCRGAGGGTGSGRSATGGVTPLAGWRWPASWPRSALAASGPRSTAASISEA